MIVKLVEMLRCIQFDKQYSSMVALKQTLSLFFLLIVSSLAACAQQLPESKAAIDTTHVYTFVEKMPQLPTGGGMGAINALLQRNLSPLLVNMKEYNGAYRPVISFVVDPNGYIVNAKMSISSNVKSMDDAIIKAAKALPKLAPGYQDGKPVAVQLSIPVRIEVR